MKIRTGFVSNSSSSSFIVEVPQDFIVTESMLKKENIDYYLCEIEIDGSYNPDNNTLIYSKCVEIVNKRLGILKNGDCVYIGEEDYALFWTIKELLEEYNHIVFISDSGNGSGEDIIEPFVDMRKK